MKRKITTLLLMLALVIASVSPTHKAEAAAKLSKTSVTLTVGKTTKIKLSGGNAKWSVKNAKIKISKQTKKSAKIKAMKKGTTYLYAKVGKKKLKCKVVCKVKKTRNNTNTNTPKFSETEAKKKITREKFSLNGYTYVKLYSGYNIATDVSATCNFYDSNGQVVDYSTDVISCLEKGRTAYASFSDSPKSYSRTEITYKFTISYAKPIASSVSLSHSFIPAADEYDEAYIMATLTNGSKHELAFADVTFIYYGYSGEIVAINDELFMSIPSGSSKNETRYLPVDENYQDIPYNRYECFVSYAYSY